MIAGLNAALFACVLFIDDGASDATALIGWGASYGPATTNGEWWRLVTAVFLQPGPFHLLFTMVGFVQIAELLERLVGPYIVWSVYLAAGVLATLSRLSQQPLGVHAGAAAADLGPVWPSAGRRGVDVCRLPAERIPLPVFKTLAPAAAMFLLYNLFSFEVSADASWRGFLVGLLAGLALTMDVGERQPSLRPLSVVGPAAVALIVYLALPLRGIVDVRPELAGLVQREDRTAVMYRAAVGRFTRSQRPVDTTVLVEPIDRTIVPQLGAARAQVTDLATPLTEHQPLIEHASEYLRLRESSWRLRADALRKHNMSTLREAEQAEQASLRALQKLRGLHTAM